MMIKEQGGGLDIIRAKARHASRARSNTGDQFIGGGQIDAFSKGGRHEEAKESDQCAGIV